MDGSRVHFTLSAPPSEASSRSSSPAPSSPFYDHNGTTQDYFDAKLGSMPIDHDRTPGRQPKDVYDTTLSWWRAGIRRKLVEVVHWESHLIAKMQKKIRRPWLDAYFVYTSSLGTHTFFMILLPAFFFFGYDEMGRGLLMILGIGVYCASVIKDLLCSPRPFAPPVTRLTIGSHHLEYGFPSTHSTNSISIALFFFGHVHRLASTFITQSTSSTNQNSTLLTNSTMHLSSPTEPIISAPLYTLLSTILLIYSFSIVFGRLYTAMHSITDCVMGVILGAGIWWGHSDWSGVPLSISSSNLLYYPLAFLGFGATTGDSSLVIYLGKGLGAGKWLEGWVQRGGWEVPLILIAICLLAVNQHPQPVDDCPCFEDAIAFAGVALGALLSRWAVSYTGAGQSLRHETVMPGSGWVLQPGGGWLQVERGLEDVMIWWGLAAVKMVVGVLTIFAWRILAKSALHLILPPTFRLLARAFRLPNRRFYTPATEYKSVPSEFHSDPSGAFGLHPIPSVIDLPSSVGVGVEVGGIGSGVDGVSSLHAYGGGHASGNGNGDLKMRNGNGVVSQVNGNEDVVTKSKNLHGQPGHDKERNGKGEDVKHYDADVLTKVIVYAGIAILAAEVLPLMFDVLGWGVKSYIEV